MKKKLEEVKSPAPSGGWTLNHLTPGPLAPPLELPLPPPGLATIDTCPISDK